MIAKILEEQIRHKKILEEIECICLNNKIFSILDIGCSTGILARKFPIATVWGIDEDSDSINQANQLAPNHVYKVGSIVDTLSGDWPKFGIVCALDILTHDLIGGLENIAFKNLLDITKKNSFLIISYEISKSSMMIKAPFYRVWETYTNYDSGTWKIETYQRL